MNSQSDTENTAEEQGKPFKADIEQIGEPLKCNICHKVYDNVKEFKDYTVYKHLDKCDVVLTIPKE